MEWQELDISTDPKRLDLALIVDYLQKDAYWTAGRTKEQIITSFTNSLCFGAYLHGRQVAFARAVTDQSTFFYLADVFVINEMSNRGIGKRLMSFILEHEAIKGSRGLLTTQTAHQFYEQFGFTRDHDVIKQRLMVLPRP